MSTSGIFVVPELEELVDVLDDGPIDVSAFVDDDGDELGTHESAFEDLQDTLTGIFRAILRSRPQRTTTDLIENEIKRVMPKPIPGPYDHRNNPLNRVPQDTLTDDRVRDCTIVGGAQTGKTLVLMNMIAIIMTVLGGAAMLTYAAEDAARKKVDEDLKPMFRSSVLLRDLVMDKNEIGAKRNRNLYWSSEIASLALAWTASNSGTKSATIKYVLNDEVDRTIIQKWGNPYTSIRMRQTKYEDEPGTKTVNCSTIEGSEKTSLIHAMFLQGDQSEPHCDCPHCGHTHIPDWEQVKIAKSPDGRILNKGHVYTCPSCGFEMPDPIRISMIKKSLRWRQLAAWDCGCGRHVDPKNDADARWVLDPVADELSQCPECNRTQLEFNSHRSFKQNILHAVHPLDKVVAEFKDAQGDPAKLKSFWNERFNRFFEIGGVAEGAKTVRDKLSTNYENFGRRQITVNGLSAIVPVEVPDFVKSVVIAVDPGKDRLEAFVGGFGDGMRFAGIDYLRLDGPVDDRRTWAKLDKLRNRQFHGIDGRLYKADMVVIDQGYRPDICKLYVDPRKNDGVAAIKGYDIGEIFSVKKIINTKFPHFPVGKLAALNVMLQAMRKRNVDDLGRKGYGEPGSMVFPETVIDFETGEEIVAFDETFWQQFTNAKIDEAWNGKRGVFEKEEKVDESVRLEAADTGMYLLNAIEHVIRSKGCVVIEQMPFQYIMPSTGGAHPQGMSSRQVVEDSRALQKAIIEKKAAPVLSKPPVQQRIPAPVGRPNPRTRIMRP